MSNNTNKRQASSIYNNRDSAENDIGNRGKRTSIFRRSNNDDAGSNVSFSNSSQANDNNSNNEFAAASVAAPLPPPSPAAPLSRSRSTIPVSVVIFTILLCDSDFIQQHDIALLTFYFY